MLIRHGPQGYFLLMAASIAQRDALQAKKAELERKLAARDVEMTELRASVMTRFVFGVPRIS